MIYNHEKQRFGNGNSGFITFPNIEIKFV